MHNQKVSLFDLDKTICKVNTSFKLGVYLYQKKFLSFHKMLYLTFYYLCHICKVISTARLHQAACHHFFYGKSIHELKHHIQNFLDINLARMLNPIVVDLLKEAHGQGHLTVILSSSPDFLVGEIAKRLNVDVWRATEYSLCSDQTIGQVSGQMEGEHKANYVVVLISSQGVLRENITAYSDSHLDLPFLEAVGVPVAVNPDRALAKVCKTRGWKVINC